MLEISDESVQWIQQLKNLTMIYSAAFVLTLVVRSEAGHNP